MLFRVGETVGHTVEYILDNMSAHEFIGWAAYFELQYEANKEAVRNLKNKQRK